MAGPPLFFWKRNAARLKLYSFSKSSHTIQSMIQKVARSVIGLSWFWYNGGSNRSLGISCAKGTHDPNFARQVDRMIEMKDGSIV